MKICNLCPRGCGIDRRERVGFCGEGEKIRIARAALHPYEEPCISGERGSGTVFFSGCNLRCVFCQNMEVSRGRVGKEVSCDELADVMLDLRDKGAENINLVTPSHFVSEIAAVLEKIKPTLGIPVVYNSGGYDSVDALKMLDGLVDVYMPDFKYCSPTLSKHYSGAENYHEVASAALLEMFRQVGAAEFNSRGMMTKGLLVRHLVLPGARRDSLLVLERLATLLPVESIKLSLMSQYTPSFAENCDFAVLKRKLTSFEYDSVLDRALALGFDGYFQSRTSATSEYTPDFKGDFL